MRRSPLPWPKRILLALLAGVLTVIASQGQWLWRQDEAAYDAMVGNWDYRPDPSVLIVAIDEGSLQRIGQWPWPRSIHARLLDRRQQCLRAAFGKRLHRACRLLRGLRNRAELAGCAVETAFHCINVSLGQRHGRPFGVLAQVAVLIPGVARVLAVADRGHAHG